MDNRLNQLENQINTLNRAVYKGDTPPPLPPPGDDMSMSGQSQADMQVRLSQLQNSITALTGRLEEEQHQVQLLQQQLSETISKLDQRIGALEQQRWSAAAAPVSAPVQSSTPAIAPEMTSSIGLTRTDMDQPPQPAADTHGSAPAPTSPPKPEPSSGTLGSLTAKGGASPDAPETAYEQAYSQLKAMQYDSAEKGFKDFLARYPKNNLAANAQYWLGETYYARAQYAKAAKAFASAYQNYPNSPKGPDALLKLGLSLNGMGDKNSACLTYGQLQKQFPSSKQMIDRAKEEASKLNCK